MTSIDSHVEQFSKNSLFYTSQYREKQYTIYIYKCDNYVIYTHAHLEIAIILFSHDFQPTYLMIYGCTVYGHET